MISPWHEYCLYKFESEEGEDTTRSLVYWFPGLTKYFTPGVQ